MNLTTPARRLCAAACAIIVAFTLAACDEEATAAEPLSAPAGDAFYDKPPADLSGYTHGDLIWSRPLTEGYTFDGAQSTLVLYAQQGIGGDTVATSGVVVVPDGEAPSGGWPVVTWAHGTTGIADQCAPTRFSPANAPREATSSGAQHMGALLQSWIDAGYAVVATDYEGLGTPGVHPYLIGDSQGRAVLDIVRAGRQLDDALSARVLVAGHSQGGHAALWAASMAPAYTSELELVGTVAYAPASHLSVIVDVVLDGDAPVPVGMIGMVLRGLDERYPGEIPVDDILTDRGQELYERTLDTCLTELVDLAEFADLDVAELGDLGSHAPLIKAKLNANDPSFPAIGGPILVVQGTDDDTVPMILSDSLVSFYEQRELDVEYDIVDGADHINILTRPSADVLAFMGGAFSG